MLALEGDRAKAGAGVWLVDTAEGRSCSGSICDYSEATSVLRLRISLRGAFDVAYDFIEDATVALARIDDLDLVDGNHS